MQILHPLCYGSFAPWRLPRLPFPHSHHLHLSTSLVCLLSCVWGLKDAWAPFPWGSHMLFPLRDVLFPSLLTEAQQLYPHASCPSLEAPVRGTIGI